MVNLPLERLCQSWNSTSYCTRKSQLFLHLLYQSSNFCFDFNLKILSATSIFVLLLPDGHLKLIKLVEKVQNSIKTRSCVRFWHTLHVKNNFFKKRSKSARQIHCFFSSKNAKSLLQVFDFGLFQQVLLTWNDNMAKEARRLKSKIEFEDWIRR